MYFLFISIWSEPGALCVKLFGDNENKALATMIVQFKVNLWTAQFHEYNLWWKYFLN